jgi:hydrogenase expression/formation protein HypC
MCLAIPARIVEFLPGEPWRALVEVAGVRRQVDTALLEGEPLQTGDWVLVHVGFALSRISEADALDQLRVLSELGEDDAAAEEFRGYDAPDTPGAESPP